MSFHPLVSTLIPSLFPEPRLCRSSGDFREIDPRMLSHVEVWRVASALRSGASSLGGAINAVTPSARTLGNRFEARVEGGRFGTWRGHAAGGHVGERSDLLQIGSASWRERVCQYV